MTAQTPILPAPSVAAPRKRGGNAQVVAIVVGAVLTVAGLGFGAAGGGVLAVFGSDGTVSSGTHEISTPTAALVSEPADLGGTSDVADVLGNPRVRLSVASSTPGKGVFVGIGPAEQVDDYLTGAPVDEVTDFDVDPFKIQRDTRFGTKRLTAPGKQSFWVARDEGVAAATLRWKVRDGNYRVVVMNADGSRDVRTKGDVGVTVPRAPDFAWALLGGGFVLLIGGVAATVVGLRRKD
jgi:hypothetical protein